MSKRNQQNVMIKGTKDGLTLHLDDSCSYHELINEIETKLSANYKFQENDPMISVKVHTGNRFLTGVQREEIQELIRTKKKLFVESITSNVISRDEAQRWKEENEITTMAKIVRSGQILEVPGDLLLIGDVNPGGIVSAGGNVFIMGVLKGIVHAGCMGNPGAVIAASVMKPSQLRIAGIMHRTPDQYSEEGQEMECAFIDDSNQIVVDKLQVLKKYRPNFDRLEGGL
ncbi:septum site-determining protein MinC [Bacillus sp. M6-12]|uniref:septum site-determining protein MinC n=1 Tax=Bacillus sp. M6-12 TaxID=2054166 RepID=UPI000C7707C5|nr:septum site-determining protein MinC [Bacillus sp. M6-12]PLS15651.1 septum site-determining protein MinC [Bacillus sp. M6-12]